LYSTTPSRSRCRMRVIDASSSSRSWLITISAPLYPARNFISQVLASTSRWFVGSSSRSRSEPPKRILASSRRRRSPPESVFTGRAQTILGQAEAGDDRLGLRLGLVAAEHRVFLLEAGEPADPPLLVPIRPPRGGPLQGAGHG